MSEKRRGAAAPPPQHTDFLADAVEQVHCSRQREMARPGCSAMPCRVIGARRRGHFAPPFFDRALASLIALDMTGRQRAAEIPDGDDEPPSLSGGPEE